MIQDENQPPENEASDSAPVIDADAPGFDMLAEAGVPCGPINNVGQTFADPQVQQLEMTPTVNHPRRGPLKVVGQAIKMSRTPSHAHSPTPDAGQHSEDVLAEVGYSAEEIGQLKEDGVI